MSEPIDNLNTTNGDDEDMQAASEKQSYRRIDMSKIKFADKPISSKEALSDVIPFQWTDEVLNGSKKVVIEKTEDEQEL